MLHTAHKTGAFEKLAEAQFYANRSMPRLHKSSLALEPVMLKSGLFRPGNGERCRFDDYVDVKAHGSHVIQFRGEELRQDDERVLVSLLKLRSGSAVDGVIKLRPRAFCRALGWASSGESTSKLRSSLVRLQLARVRIHYADGGISLYSLVSDAHLVGSEWQVWLSPRLGQMFDRSVTYLDMHARLSMRDGLESWLYGFLKADACWAPFCLADLRDMSLPSYELKEFNRHARRALDSLCAKGQIKGYELANGKLTVKK